MTWVGEGMEEETKSSELKILTLDDGSSLEYTIYFGIHLKLFLIKKKVSVYFVEIFVLFTNILKSYCPLYIGDIETN